MSDAKNPDEPVSETASVDDVVDSANAGLADAEAAAEEAVPEPVVETDAEPVVEEVVVAETVSDEDLLADADSWTEPEAVEAPPAAEVIEVVEVEESATATAAYAAEPLADEPVVTASEPVAEEPTVVVPAAVAGAAVAPAAVAPLAQPIFVQAPEPPRPRGNRAAAGAIGLLAAIAFGILYLIAYLVAGVIAGDRTFDTFVGDAVASLSTWAFWVPVVVFFLGFWLLGAIINRGGWAHWVIFGLLVGFVAYAGHILGQLFQAPFWTLTASEGAALVERELFAPLAIFAFLFGRELTIWFGAWVARRGKRVQELNNEAQREYERTLEAGPTLART